MRLTYNYIIIQLICAHLPPGRLKNWLLCRTGMDVGKNAWISPHTVLDPTRPENITIEDGGFIGWGARLFCHIISQDGEYEDGEITIKSTAFIGGFSTVHPDVTVAGMLFNNSVADDDIEEGERWAGIPAERKS